MEVGGFVTGIVAVSSAGGEKGERKRENGHERKRAR
jgi:hypothetical protein